jgi:putative peptidoglycan lipid II flippase
MATKPERRTRGGASLVAAGIFLSRISGLVRDRIFARYFGLSVAADAFRAAIRIPNMLQNLFGEGVLSASFIPVYAGLLARKKDAEAGQVAGAIFAILGLFTSVLVLLGVIGTRVFIDLIAPGFAGEKRELTILLVRVLFPGAGLLVMGAWCLGILNSHRQFFLSYAVGVLWNVAMIAALLAYGPHEALNLNRLAMIVAWASVAGNAAQFLAQLPVVLKLVPALRIQLGLQLESVQTVVRNFVPVFVSRGVVQVSAFIDLFIASFLPDFSVSAMGYAQNLYMLPISLFGMSVSASELPAMSSAIGTEEEVAAHLRKRLVGGLRRIAFLVIPSVVAFMALGDMVVGTIYEHGRFHRADSVYVWGILAGSGVGLLASTQSRLFSSAFYALKDTRTPLRFAVVRIALTTLLGYLCAFPLPALLGLDRKWGAAGLTVSAGFSGWIEFLLLRRALSQRIGSDPVGVPLLIRLWASAVAGAMAAWAIKLELLTRLRQPWLGIAVLVPYGLVYLAATGPTQLRARLRGQ